MKSDDSVIALRMAEAQTGGVAFELAWRNVILEIRLGFRTSITFPVRRFAGVQTNLEERSTRTGTLVGTTAVGSEHLPTMERHIVIAMLGIDLGFIGGLTRIGRRVRTRS